MAEHTPGPWAIEEDHDDIADTVMIHGAADQPGLVPVALVYTANAFPCIEDEDREAAEAMCKADARLIAAAPDLLAACESALAEFERITGDIGFEPERFRERLAIMSELASAVAKAAKGGAE